MPDEKLTFASAQVIQFKQQVLDHVLSLPDYEWQAHRLAALAEDRWIDAEGVDPEATPESLVTSKTAISSLPMAKILKIRGPRKSIGTIDGHPIYYLPWSGVYAWSAVADGPTLEFWLSHPAYPKGWD